MAIYHLSVKTVSRSAGRSATAAAAYRAGIEIVDERTGEIYDYSRKRGVESANIVLPDLPDGAPDWVTDRAKLWNSVEQAETRKNSTVAREFEIALPEELSPAERQRLAIDFAREIVERHGCVADVAIHAPGKKGDNRNHHAHILLSTRRLGPAGFTEKTRELDSGGNVVMQWRERFANLQNERLHEAGIEARVDHRSHKARGIEELPGQHHGPAVAGLLARGEQSHVADRVAEQAAALIAHQLADAQAAAALLEAQAAQALAELAAELEIERVQALREAAEAAEREAQARAAAEAAERLQAAQAAAQAQAEAVEAAQRVAQARAAAEARAREEAAERARAAAEAQQAAERAQAVQAVSAALSAQEAARRALDVAESKREALWPAYNAATVGQREAGASMLATARALPKAAGWQKAIKAYGLAIEALERAQKVLQRAGEKLAAALAKLEMVDPAVRERREARERATRQAYEDQQRRIAEASQQAAAQAAAGRRRGVTVHVQHQGPQDDDQEPPDVPRG